MTRGSGGVQEQLAALAGIQQLMGDPLQDLAGLMRLQQMSDTSAQGTRTEERAVRNEAFVVEQATQNREDTENERKRNFDLAKATFNQTAAVNKVALARGKASEKLANAQLAVREEELKLKQREAEVKEGQRLPDELFQQFGVVAALSRAGQMKDDPAFDDSISSLRELLDWYGYTPEDAPDGGDDAPETLEEVKKALDVVPVQGSPGDPPRGMYGHPGGGRL